MKPDERALLTAIYQQTERMMPHYHAERLGIPPNRAHYLYLKWTGKGWYEYGVSARSGWLTAKGLEAVKQLIEAKK